MSTMAILNNKDKRRNRNFDTSICLRTETREELRKISLKGVPYDTTINKLLEIVKMNPELRKQVLN